MRNWSMKKLLLASAGMAILGGGPLALAAGFLTNGLPSAGGTQFPTTIPLTGNETLPADTNLSGGASPQSESVTIAQIAGFAGNTLPKNFLLNVSANVNAQGTGEITGSAATTAMSAQVTDRWFISTNVTSGAGFGQVVTATPTPLAGFTKAVNFYRKTGALLQPVCLMQEVESTRARQMQGKNVVFSTWIQALAALTATANAVTLNVITGTGVDQGLATMTASPAVTPAWTGIATAGTVTVNSTTSWVRYNTAPIAIASTVNEVAVQICFTPVGASSGTTDGISVIGQQLEIVQGTSTTLGQPGPSPVEVRDIQDDLRDAQRFFWVLNEPASGAGVNAFGQATGANTNTITVPLPVQMRGTVPTVTITTAGTFKVNIAGTPTTFATPTAGVCSVLACTVTGANTNTAGQAEQVTGGGGTGAFTFASDVVM